MPSTQALADRKGLEAKIAHTKTLIIFEATMVYDLPDSLDRLRKLEAEQQENYKLLEALIKGYDPYLKGMSWIPSS